MAITDKIHGFAPLPKAGYARGRLDLATLAALYEKHRDAAEMPVADSRWDGTAFPLQTGFT